MPPCSWPVNSYFRTKRSVILPTPRRFASRALPQTLGRRSFGLVSPPFQKKGAPDVIFARREVKKGRCAALFSPLIEQKGPPTGLFAPSFQKISRPFAKFSQMEALRANREHLFSRMPPHRENYILEFRGRVWCNPPQSAGTQPPAHPTQHGSARHWTQARQRFAA